MIDFEQALTALKRARVRFVIVGGPAVTIRAPHTSPSTWTSATHATARTCCGSRRPSALFIRRRTERVEEIRHEVGPSRLAERLRARGLLR